MSARSNPDGLRVDAAGGAYRIHVTGDGLAGLGGVVRPWSGRRAALVTDRTVDALYGDETSAVLTAAGVEHARIAVPAGEASKSFARLEALLDELLAARIPRDGVVVALGGGVVGDLAGLAASLLRRGVACVQVPTSLVAQVDSAIGGKTAINTARGKNLVGTFHAPAAVFASTRCLATLPMAERRAGMAEVVKYGLLAGDPLLTDLERDAASALAADPAVLEPLVRRCAGVKADVVGRDEKEGGLRRLLNLGHTVGHALERSVGPEPLRHGEAVAIGLVAACELSAARGLADGGLAERTRVLLEALGLPVASPPVDREVFRAALAQDKKATRGAMQWVLLRAPGEPVIEPATQEVSDAWLDELTRRGVLGWTSS